MCRVCVFLFIFYFYKTPYLNLLIGFASCWTESYFWKRTWHGSFQHHRTACWWKLLPDTGNLIIWMNSVNESILLLYVFKFYLLLILFSSYWRWWAKAEEMLLVIKIFHDVPFYPAIWSYVLYKQEPSYYDAWSV